MAQLVQCWLLAEPVDSAPCIILGGLDGEAEPLLDRSGQKTSGRVAGPRRGLDNLRDCRSLGAAQHLDHQRLLGALAGVALR